MTAAPVTRSDRWEEEGRRVATQLAEVSSAVVVGADADRAARVAVGIARAESERRHVALGDLVGDLAPVYALAGGEDAFGLTDCFREGLPLNDIARPVPDAGALFVLPAGTPPVATTDVLGHERWPKLVAGFRDAGALLLLVAPPDAPALPALVAATNGVVAVDVPPTRLAGMLLLATVEAPVPVAVEQPPRAASRRRRAVVLAAATVVLAAAAIRFGSRRAPPPRPVPATPSAAPTPVSGATAPVASTDTIHLGPTVDPADSGRALAFAVEVVAANTLAGANSMLSGKGNPAYPASTVAPVQLGGGAIWYRVVIGAWRDRVSADSLLGVLRSTRAVPRGAGAVVRVPYAVLLADSVAPTRAAAVVDQWRSRGIGAYALMQDDGSVRVFAGAFETPAQAAPLAASVRDAGSRPAVAYRTGRTF